MFRRRYQILELIPKDPDIGQRCKVMEMDDLEEQQFIVYTISNANFERRFLEIENHLAHLVELLASRENVNVIQRQKNKF